MCAFLPNHRFAYGWGYPAQIMKKIDTYDFNDVMEFPEDIEAAIPTSELLNQISHILMVKVDQVIYMIKKYLDEDGDISDRLSILTTMIETEPYCRGLLTVVNHVTGHSFSSQEDFLKFYFGDNNGEANICRVLRKHVSPTRKSGGLYLRTLLLLLFSADQPTA